MSCSTRRTAALAILSWRRPRAVSSVGRALPTGARAGRTTSPWRSRACRSQGLLALSAEDIEWIVPGQDWPLAGTHRGHAGLENLLQKANETVETSYPEP